MIQTVLTGFGFSLFSSGASVVCVIPSYFLAQVFLDHHMLLFLHEFDQLNEGHVDKWNKHIIGIRALVKGAENLIK